MEVRIRSVVPSTVMKTPRSNPIALTRGISPRSGTTGWRVPLVRKGKPATTLARPVTPAITTPPPIHQHPRAHGRYAKDDNLSERIEAAEVNEKHIDDIVTSTARQTILKKE